MKRLLVLAALVACGDNVADWRPERETAGTFTGDLGDVCTCTGGPPFEVSCCKGFAPYPKGCTADSITIDLPFNYDGIPPDVRWKTTVQFHRNGLTGFVDLTAWFDGTVIDDPTGTPKHYRALGIDDANAKAQPLCVVETGRDCVDGFTGFTLKDVRLWCEVTP